MLHITGVTAMIVIESEMSLAFCSDANVVPTVFHQQHAAAATTTAAVIDL